MKDTIYRQAAIEVADAVWCVTGDKNVAKVWDQIKDLPSAQPEIIRCKDCKHRILNEHAGEKGRLNLKAICELDTGDPFELGRLAEDDEWFCADAERVTDE